MKIARLSELKSFSDEKMKKTKLFETDRFFLDVYGFEPGQEQKLHRHDGEDKVYYVLEGRGEFTVGSEVASLGPGEAVLAPAGDDHAAANPGPDQLVVLAFMAPHP